MAADATWYDASALPAPSRLPIGRPIDNLQVDILDPDLNPVPAGDAGELYVGGEGLARGYLNRPGLTGERFVPKPSGPDRSARIFKTGDLGRWLPDGHIEYLGRRDHQVQIRGMRLELGEIEAALEQHPEVHETVVVAQATSSHDTRLVAYVVYRELHKPRTSELRSWLVERLPRYMVPNLFYALDALPRTPNGKINRQALPSLGSLAAETTPSDNLPRTPVETRILGIWAEVLDRDAIGMDDDFFDLGGHSLLAIQVLSRLRQTFAVDASLRMMFEHPTIAGLAERLEMLLAEGGQSSMTRIEPVARHGRLPLSLSQQGLWLIDQLETPGEAYHLSFALRFRGDLHLATLESCLTEIVRRHGALRTTFDIIDGTPSQVIAEATPIALVLRETAAGPDDSEAVLRRVLREEGQRVFDLAHGPLQRVMAVRLAPDDHVLLMTMHHIIFDEASWRILIHELTALYSAFVAGNPSPLTEPVLQYADFAHWQRQWLTGDVLESHLAYWRRKLSGAPDLLVLPTDRTRPAVQRFQGALEVFYLSPELTEAIKSLGRRCGTTLFMTLLMAYAVLLARYCDVRDVLIGTPSANRDRCETESIIGYFVHTLVLRIQMADNPTCVELLRHVQEVVLEAYEHQALPFEKLVEMLQPERHLSYNPVFQVTLSKNAFLAKFFTVGPGHITGMPRLLGFGLGHRRSKSGQGRWAILDGLVSGDV